MQNCCLKNCLFLHVVCSATDILVEATLHSLQQPIIIIIIETRMPSPIGKAEWYLLFFVEKTRHKSVKCNIEL